MKHQFCFMLMLILLILVNTTCKHSGNSLTNVNEGTEMYRYLGFDAEGNEVVTGTITLQMTNSLLTGQANLTGASWEAVQGPIKGRMLDSITVELWFKLGQVPSVILKGIKDDSTIQGSRYLDTGGPPVPKWIGTFRAVRITTVKGG